MNPLLQMLIDGGTGEDDYRFPNYPYRPADQSQMRVTLDNMKSDPFGGMKEEIAKRRAAGMQRLMPATALSAGNGKAQAALDQIRGINKGLPGIAADARKNTMRDQLAMKRAKLGADLGSYQNPEMMRAGNADQIASALQAQRRGAAPGQNVDPRWALGGISVSGQRPAGAPAQASSQGSDPLEQIHRLVSENRPMGEAGLRERQGRLTAYGPRNGVAGKYNGGSTGPGNESVVSLPGQGYREQKTPIALHGPSSQFAMNQAGMSADRQGDIRNAAAAQKQAAIANTIRMQEKIKLNRQQSALRNAQQMAGSIDPRRQYQSQMIMGRQLQNQMAGGAGSDPLQQFAARIQRLGLPPQYAAALVQQQQHYLNALELERQKQFGNIESGRASGAIPKDYKNPFGQQVPAAGLPADGAAPAGAPAPAPAAATPQYRSFKERLAMEAEAARAKAIKDEEDRVNQSYGEWSGSGF